MKVAWDYVGSKVAPYFNKSLPTKVTTPATTPDVLIPVESKVTPENNRCAQFIEKTCERIARLFYSIYYFFKKLFFGEPVYKIPQLQVTKLFSEEEVGKMRKSWWQLGKEKWKEAIDGKDHKHGKWVFDQGLHGGTIEEGFVVSMEKNAFPFMSQYLGTKTTTEMFLELHKAACWHFKGAANGTLMGTDRIGKFRTLSDHLYYTCTITNEKYVEGLKEIVRFKDKLGTLAWITGDKKKCKVSYALKSSEEVRAHLQSYLDEFYVEIGKAVTKKEKILAIVWLAKKMDWLHACRDGCGRSSVLFLQKHLTEYVGHPTIMESPAEITQMPLLSLVTTIEEGLEKWEKLAAAAT